MGLLFLLVTRAVLPVSPERELDLTYQIDPGRLKEQP